MKGHDAGTTQVQELDAIPCPCPLFDHVPVAMLLADQELNVIEGNDAFWSRVCGCDPAPEGTPLRDALPAEMFSGVEKALGQAIENGEPTEVPGLQLYSSGQPQRVIDLRVSVLSSGDRRVIMIAVNTIPDTGRRLAELTLLNDMVRVLRQETEIDQVLFAALTCATAGTGGIGFNRAWLLVVDSSGEWLEGRMALGPGSEEEAHEIWAQMAAEPHSLDDFTAAYDRWAERECKPLQDKVHSLRFSMEEDADRVPVLAAAQRRAIKIENASEDERVGDELRELLDVEEFVVVPMIVSDQPRGVLMADNRYSREPITDGDIRLLTLFAQHAGLAIESALAYEQLQHSRRELENAYTSLQHTQAELVRAEQLAAIGEMSARIAHDLRNPLVTIGGWARDLEEDPSDPEIVRHAAEIIANEAANLEEILSMLLEPMAERQLHLRPIDLNSLVVDRALACESTLEDQGIDLRLNLAEGLPRVRGDIAHLRRSLQNLIDNAADATPEGGTITLSTWQDQENLWLRIEDTGVGLSKEASERIFDAFYSTKHYGSGIGLAVVWDTVRSHGFDIDVESDPNQGTAFAIRIPKMHTVQDSGEQEAEALG
ncbi:MAG: ATP-binding protein [Armatimonadota bacterium]